MALTEQTRAEMMDLAARYPQPRSALLPMLHLAQSVEGYVTPEAIATITSATIPPSDITLVPWRLVNDGSRKCTR